MFQVFPFLLIVSADLKLPKAVKTSPLSTLKDCKAVNLGSDLYLAQKSLVGLKEALGTSPFLIRDPQKVYRQAVLPAVDSLKQFWLIDNSNVVEDPQLTGKAICCS